MTADPGFGTRAFPKPGCPNCHALYQELLRAWELIVQMKARLDQTGEDIEQDESAFHASESPG